MKPIELDYEINNKEKELHKLQEEISSKNHEIQSLTNDSAELSAQISELKSQLTSVTDEISMESFGLYKPRYEFANSSAYKAKLLTERSLQKEMIKNNRAGIITT